MLDDAVLDEVGEAMSDDELVLLDGMLLVEDATVVVLDTTIDVLVVVRMLVLEEDSTEDVTEVEI
jgi:hypothetical protein